jgi:hypothetical protein
MAPGQLMNLKVSKQSVLSNMASLMSIVMGRLLVLLNILMLVKLVICYQRVRLPNNLLNINLSL